MKARSVKLRGVGTGDCFAYTNGVPEHKWYLFEVLDKDASPHFNCFSADSFEECCLLANTMGKRPPVRLEYAPITLDVNEGWLLLRTTKT